MKQRLLAFLITVFAFMLLIALAIIMLVADLWDKLCGKKLAAVDYYDDYDN